MTDLRDKPDPLGVATDRAIGIIRALLPPERAALADELGRALGDLFAELIGRAAAQSASVVAPFLIKVEDVERRERARYDRLRDVERTVNGRVDTLWAHYEAMPDINEAVYQLARDVEALKERQAGGDGERS